MAEAAKQSKVTGKPPHLKLADDTTPTPAPVVDAPQESKAPARPPMFGFARKVPARPAGLSPDARWFWDYVTEQAKSFQLLKPLDGPALHVTAETYSRWRTAVRARNARGADHRGLGAANSQGVVTAYWIGIEERAATQLMKFFQEFGLTPAAERHVSEVGVGDVGDTAGDAGASGDADNPY